jgi:phosphoserine aminotransferase
MLDFHGHGMSLIEMSHRSPEYEAVHHDAMQSFRSLYGVPGEFEILFLQGGATLQFAMVPMNLLHPGDRAGYVRSGTWGVGAESDASFYGQVYPAWDGRPFGYSRMPDDDELVVEPGSNYLHVTSNETIEGIRYADFPDVGVPLVADMSSDYMSRPIPWERFDLVYGGSQKNLGPAGLVVVVLRRELLERTNRNHATYLRFDLQAEKKSLLNTPPMFPIYVMGKTLAWIESQGGVEAMQTRAMRRSGEVYDAIDDSGGFYRSPVEAASRSHMNMVFRLPDAGLEAAFLAAAEEEGMVNLRGHRSVGGIRASIYNAMSDEGVSALSSLMRSFAADHG